jgi:PhnB protein
MATRLNPYLHFDGNAREAMEFYRDALGGDLSVTSFGEGGVPHDPADADKLMHAQLETANGQTLMAADTPTGQPGGGSGFSGVSMSLSGEDDAELTGYWDKLRDGGNVFQPLEAAPWGDKFGMLIDRFGVTWFVNITGAGAGATHG